MEHIKTNQIQLSCPHCGQKSIIIDVYKTGKGIKNEIEVRRFVDECCYIMPGIETPASVLYRAFKVWWNDGFTDSVISQKAFGLVLKNRFKSRKFGTYLYSDIGLLADLKK